MNNALIGFSGFVGSTLMKQALFNSLYRSTNITDILGKTFDTVVCSGAPAQKWIANKEPEQDKKNISGLIANLESVSAKKFILISTVDVFKNPIDVNESTPIDLSNLHPYGENRYMLEKFVSENFSDYLIVRLPGLVGPGLRKNIIFDFQNDNNVAQVDSRSVFQFYPMVNLWLDIQNAINNNIKLIHLTSEPISVAEVANLGFGIEFNNHVSTSPAYYDFKSIHSEAKDYQYSKREIVQAIRSYAQSEPKTIKGNI
jgi:nucleoside-diphosphate-sugar epimerase